MIGRRVQSFADLTEPGDYCGPYRSMAGPEAVHFRLPVPLDEAAPPGARSIYSVQSPPHVFRECPDGSLEIRESIGARGNDPNVHIWHGYLDEGHVWRTV